MTLRMTLALIALASASASASAGGARRQDEFVPMGPTPVQTTRGERTAAPAPAASRVDGGDAEDAGR